MMSFLSRRSARLLILLLAGVGLAVALFLRRASLLWPGQPRVPAVIARARAQLALGPVLAAEAALQQSPDDGQARLRLASACASTGDPVGAALALSPLVTPNSSSRPRSAATTGSDSDALLQFARHCLATGWMDEAAAALQRLPDAPARAASDLAAAYVEHGEAARAAALLKGLGREGLNPDDRVEGAITWYHCRRLEEAVEWARRSVAMEPENPAARAVLAHCLLAMRRPEAALQALALSTPSPDPMLEFWRARAEVRCRDAALRKSGREQLARLAGQPGNGAAAFEAGRSFVLAGEPRRAVALLSRAAVSGYQEVLCYALLSQVYESLGRSSEALWARARSQSYRGRFAEASAALRRSLELDATKPAASIDLAWALQSEGKPREAVAALERAQQVAPGNMDVRLLKARLLLQLERVPDVIRELNAAAALDPKRANEPLGNLGTVYYDSQQYDRAVPVLERAVRLEDADAHSHFYLGRTYARRLEEPHRAEMALDHLLRAAQLEPADSRPWIAAASVLQRMGYLSEAAACLRRAIAGESQSDAPYVALGQILQMQGRLPERRLILERYAASRDHDLTRTGLEKQTRDNPKDAERRYALGDMLLREGRPERALPELLISVGLRPGWKQARARLADASALLGFDDLREEAEVAAR